MPRSSSRLISAPDPPWEGFNDKVESTMGQKPPTARKRFLSKNAAGAALSSALAVLPPFSRLVIDEAHHLEEVATRYFSTQVTRFAFARTLNRLRHPRKPQRGLLPRLIIQLGRSLPDDQDALYRELHERIEALIGQRQELLDRSIADLEQSGIGLAKGLGAEIR